MIKPNKKYTFAELEKIRNAHPNLSLEYTGYVWRAELDGTMMLVHHSQASGGGGRFDRPNTLSELEAARVSAPVTHPDLQSESLPRIVKRTPQQRIDSLMAKVSQDFVEGRVLTLDEVNTHRDGRAKATELTGEVVKEVVSAFLQTAENENEAREAKKVTRTAPSD
jgi:hypothetical protein